MVDKTVTDLLNPGDMATYESDPFVLEGKGIHVIHASFFDDAGRIGHATEYLRIA